MHSTPLQAARRGSRAGRLAFVAWAGCALALLAGCRPPQAAKPDFSAPEIPGSDLVVLEMEGEQFTAGEVYHKIRLQYPKMLSTGPTLGRQAREITKSMLNEALFARAAEDLGLDQVPDAQRMLYLSRDYILSTEGIRRLVWEPVQPSEAEIGEFYAANLERFRVRPKVWYHEILADSRAEAEALRGRLLAGEAFDDLARAHSRDATYAPRGGEMPPYEVGSQHPLLDRLPELAEALLALEPQAISEPIQTDRGWHLLRLDNRRAEHLRTLEEVRPELVQQMSAKREGERYQAVLDSLAARYRIRMDEEALERFYFLQMDDEQLFTIAPEDNDAGRRVRMYESLRERFPQSPRVAEALFMIGFEKAEKIGDLPGAREAFTRFLAEYPQHAMSESARAMLRDLETREASPSPAPASEAPPSRPPQP